MKIENLSVNQRIKNYKELCNILGIEVKNGGASKKAQFKELERFVRYEKDKNSFIIKEIYKQPIEAVSKGGNNTIGKYAKTGQFKIDDKYKHYSGIYKIQLENKIYIGSTVNFKKRFSTHYANKDGNHNKTQELLLKGATFESIKMFKQIDRNKLYKLETQIIHEYMLNSDFILINETVNKKRKYDNKQICIIDRKTGKTKRIINIKLKSNEYIEIH